MYNDDMTENWIFMKGY
jgi:hypothetical protein